MGSKGAMHRFCKACAAFDASVDWKPTWFITKLSTSWPVASGACAT